MFIVSYGLVKAYLPLDNSFIPKVHAISVGKWSTPTVSCVCLETLTERDAGSGLPGFPPK